MNSSQKWLAGCGGGCLLLILVVAVLIGGGLFFGKRMVADFERVEDSRERLVARYGEVDSFRPEPDGSIPSERVEVFLQVRQRLEPDRLRMERRLERLSDGVRGGGVHNPLEVIRMARDGAGLLPAIARYLQARHDALLEQGMGLGEYLHVYTMAYPLFGGHPIGDGPPFPLMGDGDRDAESRDLDEEEIVERREEWARRRLHRALLPMLRHQWEDLLDDDGGPWRERLREEIAALERDHFRLPWEDGIPERLRLSLEPYRERLEASYSAMCHPLELGPAEH